MYKPGDKLLVVRTLLFFLASSPLTRSSFGVDARASEGMGGSGAAGGRGGGANADPVSRQLGMTLDEAANILNVKKPSEAFKDSELQQMLKVCPPSLLCLC